MADEVRVAAWFERVIKPVFEQRCTGKQRAKIQQNARIIDEMMGEITTVSFHAESGEELNNIFDASARTGLLKAAEPHVRLYVLQIIRFLASVLSELGYQAQVTALADIPYLSDFFKIYNNDDAMLKSRKTWSIYRP